MNNLRSYYRGCYNRDLRDFYDLESQLPYFDHAGRILGAHKQRLMIAWIGQRPVHGPILELGSGIGALTRQLGDRGYRVVAIDISPLKTAKAQRLTQRHYGAQAPPVTYLTGDLRDLGRGSALDQAIRQTSPVSAPPFDVLIAADVLEHIPASPDVTIQRLGCLLAPHGRLFVSVPSRLCVNDPGHFWTLLPAQWEQIFIANGLRLHQKRMSRLCWYGLPTPLPLAMVYELRHATPITSPVCYGSGQYATQRPRQPGDQPGTQ